MDFLVDPVNRVLLFSEIFPPEIGGSGNWFYQLYARLEQSVVVVANLSGNLLEKEKMGNLDIHRFSFRPESYRHLGIMSVKQLKYYARIALRLNRLVKTENIQAIHCGKSLPEGLVALLIKITKGIPYYLYVHGEEIESALLSREYKLLNKLVLRNARKIVCNSKNTKRLLKKWGEAIHNNAIVLYPGVDTEYFKPVKDIQNPYAGKRLITTISRLQKRKGHANLIEAIGLLKQKIPDVQYLIVGDGEEKANLESLIKEKNLEDYVKILTDVDNEGLIRFYNYADIFVLPNIQVGNDIEGLGIVLLEAQACGTPVIAGQSGGTLEALSPNVTGQLVDANNIQKLAETIEGMLMDRKRLGHMSTEAREFVEHQFSWKVQIDRAKDALDLQ